MTKVKILLFILHIYKLTVHKTLNCLITKTFLSQKAVIGNTFKNVGPQYFSTTCSLFGLFSFGFDRL